MSAPRPHEALAVLRAAEEMASADPSGVLGALATLVTLDGAAAERSGAMLLLGDETVAALPGVTPLASVPAPLREAAERALAERRCALAELELGEDDELFGAAGLSGRAEVWLEPVDGELREALRAWREALLQGEGAVVECVLAGPGAGRRRLLAPGDESARECWRAEEPELEETASGRGVLRVFRAPYAPMGKALLLGSGPELRRLAALLDGLGFSVTVADPRPGRLHGEGWDRARWRLVEGGWDAARSACRPDEATSIVVALRSHDEDLRALKGALQTPARYVGLAGPAARGARLLAELREAGVEAAPGVLSAPAGLDVGAEAAEETALALAAEILAVRAGRKGGRTGRLRPAGSSPAQRKGGVRIPGLVLAAGRGKRFGAASKLLADVDGQPVLRHVVEAALAAKLDPVIVVLGAGAEAGLQAIEGLDDARLRVVFNPSWKSGKASSIETGLREVPADAPGVVALLGDMPRVPTWLIERVRSEFELSGRLTFPVFPGDEGPEKGHPTAYPRELFGEVGQLVGDDTALEAARRHWGEAVKIPLEDGRTQADIDTAADLELLRVRPDAQGNLL
jgi:xanthine dehydrogenase accessory factor